MERGVCNSDLHYAFEEPTGVLRQRAGQMAEDILLQEQLVQQRRGALNDALEELFLLREALACLMEDLG